MNDPQMEVPQNSDQSQKSCQFHMLYDQHVYVLIFWTGSGGWRIFESEERQYSAPLIRRALISFV
jgi:hypothetical protein